MSSSLPDPSLCSCSCLGVGVAGSCVENRAQLVLPLARSWGRFTGHFPANQESLFILHLRLVPSFRRTLSHTSPWEYYLLAEASGLYGSYHLFPRSAFPKVRLAFEISCRVFLANPPASHTLHVRSTTHHLPPLHHRRSFLLPPGEPSAWSRGPCV